MYNFIAAIRHIMPIRIKNALVFKLRKINIHIPQIQIMWKMLNAMYLVVVFI
jgi:hypothetical protein